MADIDLSAHDAKDIAIHIAATHHRESAQAHGVNEGATGGVQADPEGRLMAVLSVLFAGEHRIGLSHVGGWTAWCSHDEATMDVVASIATYLYPLEWP